MPQISYQLYCSRGFPPLKDTLMMLSDIGYREVEGFGGLLDDIDGLKADLDRAGLKMTSCHIGLDQVQSGAGLKIAHALGLEAVFVPFLQPNERPKDAKGWAAFGQTLAEAGKPLMDAGIAFGWHNHDFECVVTDSGEMPLDLIVAASDDMRHELDIGWVARAGHDPAAWVNKYAGRIASAHIKDIAPSGECADEDGWADVGHGTLDWPAIHAALQAAGVARYVVEHDNPSDHQRFASRSFATISKF
jgi:sugar phosphate isomerase/epimerase